MVAGLTGACLTAGALTAASPAHADQSDTADVRVASDRAAYNNGLPAYQHSELAVWVYNAGPATARNVKLNIPYTWRMRTDPTKQIAVSQVLRAGEEPSSAPLGGSKMQWSCDYDMSDDSGKNSYHDTWLAKCSLGNLAPRTRVHVTYGYTLTIGTAAVDRNFTTWATTDSDDPFLGNNQDTYTITPNHNSDTPYWDRPGRKDQLDDLDTSRGCDTGLARQTEVLIWSKDAQGTYRSRPTRIDAVREGDVVGTWKPSDDANNPHFERHRVTRVHKEEVDSVEYSELGLTGPDKKRYSIVAARDERFLIQRRSGESLKAQGFWRAGRLWHNAPLYARKHPGGTSTIVPVESINHGSAPGTLYSLEVEGVHNFQLAAGPFVHNGPPGCNAVNLAAASAAGVALNDAIGRVLRPRPPTAPPAPRRPGPPVLPVDVPRQDADGNWLIYLYREDTPGVVTHIEEAVNEYGHPWRLTYDPAGADRRRRESLRGSPSFTQVIDAVSGPRQGRPDGMIDRDEYPPAVSAEGGASASVVYMDAEDNQRAGRLMGRQFAAYGMSPGDHFRFVIIEPDYSSVTFIGDDAEHTARNTTGEHRLRRDVQSAQDASTGSWALVLYDAKGNELTTVTGQCAKPDQHHKAVALPSQAAQATDYLLQTDCLVRANIGNDRQEDLHHGYNTLPSAALGTINGITVYDT